MLLKPDLKIPPEAVEAALKSYTDSTRYTTAKRIEDAIQAAIATWPGMYVSPVDDGYLASIIHLPYRRRTAMSESDAEFVERMQTLFLRCQSPNFEDGKRLFSLARRRTQMSNDYTDGYGAGYDAGYGAGRKVADEELAALRAEVEKLQGVLHRISLGSQNSGTTKEDLGREARAALQRTA